MTREQSDILVRIKRAVIAGLVSFSRKARQEMDDDGLTDMDIAEAILNAPAIYKKIRSRNPFHPEKMEYLYIIQGVNLDGIFIYTKGKFIKNEDKEIFYFLISSKRSI